MAPHTGTTSYTAAGPHERLGEVDERLALALERADIFEALVDPRLLRELREVIHEVLELAGDAPACPYDCAGRMHCPGTEPLDRILAGLQRNHWVPDWDSVEARVAHDTVCVCGGRLSYLALRPEDGDLATAWAVCCVCRHWIAL
jgi:hypothetical protein